MHLLAIWAVLIIIEHHVDMVGMLGLGFIDRATACVKMPNEAILCRENMLFEYQWPHRLIFFYLRQCLSFSGLMWGHSRRRTN